MRVMVTGGYGFLGSHTVQAILEAGHDVRLLVRSVERAEAGLASVGLDLPDHVLGDITDARSVTQALEGCDAAVHAAAIVSASPQDEERLVEANTKGTETVLGAAAEAGCDPIVHVSSSAALFPFEDTVTPDHPVGSMTGGYGRSKAQAERLARSLQDEGHPVSIVYPTGILGPDAPGLSETLNAAVFWLTKGCPRGGGMAMAIVDVRDVAAAIAALLEPGQGPRRYLAWGHLLAMGEIADLLGEITGRPVKSPKVPGGVIRAWGAAGDLARRVGKDLTLTGEGAKYLLEFAPGDQSATERDLGIEFRPPERTLSDFYRWAHREGYLTADQVGMLAA